jgi:predicted AAA+ superfamily ATPase
MPVYYNEQGKISSVEFSDDFGVAPSLLGAAEWKPNSGLSIITGVNGSGKSQLLNLLNKSSPRQNRKIIYVDSYFNPRSYNSSEYTDGQNLIQ